MRVRNAPRLAWAFIEVLTEALRVEFALRRRPFERVLGDASARRLSCRNSAEIPVATLCRAIRMAYWILPVEGTCLKQSLVFCRVRRRCGLPAELKIGVQKNEGVFAAHAWVEDGAGRVLTDPQEGFSPLPLPAGPATRDAKAND